MPATRTPHDPPAASVLFVDDIPELCQHMVATLSGAGIEATAIGRPSEALPQIIAGKYQVVITTLVMVEMCGFDIIRKIRGAGCDVPIIMITGYGTEQSAIEAARLGVADYMTKPIADAEVIARVRRVLAGVTPPGQTRPRKLAKMISVDPRMLEIFDWVKTIAPTDSRALILGQTGCGKQLLAHAIHQQSRRAKEPFVEVNCAAIPANLLESELFGHEAGAFTGASSRRIGRFEQAGGGTLFLDEIGELGFDLQSKLLHVLEAGNFSRVGSGETLRSVARLVTATNRDLEHEVEQGRFRADLFYRLNVISIELPPLAERRGDVPLLAEHFLRRFIAEGRPVPTFTKSALAVLCGYGWPGNVRELQNVAEQLAVLHRGERIEATELPDRILRHSGAKSREPDVAADNVSEAAKALVGTQNQDQGLGGLGYGNCGGAVPPEDFMRQPFRLARESFEKEYLRQAIERCGGNLAGAAREAEVDRGQFYRLAKRHGLAGEGQP